MERKVCTKENPMPQNDDGFWAHPDANYIEDDFGKGGGVADSDYEIYKCPNCNLRFKVQLGN